MTPSQYAKHKGLDSLTEVSRITDVSLQTLNNWHRDKPLLFKTVILGCVFTVNQSYGGNSDST